jgi:hypothetical protein
VCGILDFYLQECELIMATDFTLTSGTLISILVFIFYAGAYFFIIKKNDRQGEETSKKVDRLGEMITEIRIHQGRISCTVDQSLEQTKDMLTQTRNLEYDITGLKSQISIFSEAVNQLNSRTNKLENRVT